MNTCLYNALKSMIDEYHGALRDGNRVIFYDKETFKAVSNAISGWVKEPDSLRDFEFGVHPWSDQVHETCVFAWVDYKTMEVQMLSFDAYR